MFGSVSPLVGIVIATSYSGGGSDEDSHDDFLSEYNGWKIWNWAVRNFQYTMVPADKTIIAQKIGTNATSITPR